MKTLEIGKNYGGCFGLESDKGQKMIYLGGNKWRGENGEKSVEKDCDKTTAKAIEYINRPSVMMGSM